MVFRGGFIKKYTADFNDFCILSSPPESRLSQFERLTLVGGSELERALQWVIRQCSIFSFPDAVAEIDLDLFKQDVAFYSQQRWIENPQSFFVSPVALPEVQTTLVHGLRDGVVLDLEFKSQYLPQLERFRSAPDKSSENDTVFARMWQHDIPAKGTMIALHGWTMGDQRLNSLAFLPGMFYRFGLDVVLVELPYHGRRKSKEQGESHLFPSGNLARTNEAIAQTISDLRSLHAFLSSKGSQQIGCVGMSLGAYMSALWASLDPISFCIPIVPVVSMADMAWRMAKKEPIFRALRREGFSRELLNAAYKVHCPLTHTPKISPDQALILGGLGDTIVPRSQPKMLWSHWGNPRLHWFKGGHLAQFKSKHAMTRILRFLRERELLGE